MIDHIGLAVTDIVRSRAFYEAALKPLGYRSYHSGKWHIKIRPLTGAG